MTIARAALCVAGLLGAIVVSACGMAGQPPSAAATSSRSSESWMSPETQGQDLLYLSDISDERRGHLFVSAWPTVGKLKASAHRGANARIERATFGSRTCRDTTSSSIRTGAQTPGGLSTPGAPRGCSVDPRTGELAVTGGVSGMILAVYHRTKHNSGSIRKSTPTRRYRSAAFCGFDAEGNLFIDGLDKARAAHSGWPSCRDHATGLVDISVNQRIAGAGQVQWDGRPSPWATRRHPSVIYQFSVRGSAATLVGSTTLDGAKSVRQFGSTGRA